MNAIINKIDKIIKHDFQARISIAEINVTCMRNFYFRLIIGNKLQ
jgi:hypothetical protein